jgi:hypothetical protein
MDDQDEKEEKEAQCHLNGKDWSCKTKDHFHNKNKLCSKM